MNCVVNCELYIWKQDLFYYLIPMVKGAPVRLSLTEDNGILTAPKSCTRMDSVKLWRLSNFQATAVPPGGAGHGA